MLSTNVKFMPCDYLCPQVARAAASTGPESPVSTARHPGRSLTLIISKLHIGPRPQQGRSTPRPRGARPPRCPHCSAPARGSTRRSPAQRGVAAAQGGGGERCRRRRRAVPGACGPRRHGSLCVRVWTVTWSPGGEWPHTHRGMRACVRVCACTTVRPLAWAAAFTTQYSIISHPRHAHAHANTAGWPTRAHTPD